jgi:tRNA modification GTPase
MKSRDIIAAIATAPGRAGIGIVRISGSHLEPLAERLTGRAVAPRKAVLAPFRDAAGEAIDEGIALFFRAPRSYTGEDVLELHGHGGPVVLRRLLQRCLELGARVAEPGEFTQRAYLNGKLDLLQAEGVIDLIDATTAQAARSAMRSLHGEFSSAIHKLTDQLIELRALLEATLDFPEEEVDALDRQQVAARLARVRAALDTVLEAARQGSLLREGLHIVLAGAPNVGKSSLLNRLAGEDLAIVTDIPGTTRDPVRQALDIEGVPVHVVDTAGLREPCDPVERIGIERAWSAIERADVIVHLTDARATPLISDTAIEGRLPRGLPRIMVVNKIDLAGRGPAIEQSNGQTTVWLSAKTGAGVDLLRQALLAQAGWHGHGEAAFLARERHLRALGTARGELAAAAAQGPPELIAEHLRLAHEALSSITGEFGADDLLGEIFQRFCIGK